MEVTKGFVIDDAFDEKCLYDENGRSLVKGSVNKRGKELISIARKDAINLSIISNPEMCATYLRYMDELSGKFKRKPFVVLGNINDWGISEQEIMNRLTARYIIINMPCSPKDYNHVGRHYLKMMADYRKQSGKRKSTNLSFAELKRRDLIKEDADKTEKAEKKEEEDLSGKSFEELLIKEDNRAGIFYSIF